MIAQLTRNERQGAILISLAVALCGLVLGLAGRDDPIGRHGALIFVAGVLTIFLVGRDCYAPEPADDWFAYYYDDPNKVGIIAAMIWVVFGLAIGDWATWQLVNPDLTFGGGWSSFGRMRPVHTTSVIFGFGGNAPIATSLYVLQRTSRAPAGPALMKGSWDAE
jgi:cytochrome c oxidase cbb3-type subunit I